MSNLKILIAGDLFPRDRQEQELFIKGDTEKLFSSEILEMFQSSDLRVCNLEGALTDSEIKRPKCGPSIKASPAVANGIKALGVDYVSLANNHVTDYDDKGYEDTVNALTNHGIGYFGAGKNSSDIKTHIKLEIKEKTIVIYSVSETVFNIPDDKHAGVNLYDEYRVCRELETLKKTCDYLIVLYHGGMEGFQYPTPWVRQRFHRMADNGADVVLAQHTHCIGTQENYNGAYLLYGQGNFCFYHRGCDPFTETGLLLEINAGENGLDIKNHLVRTKNGKTVYDPNQDLTDFSVRNQRLLDGDLFEKEFSDYSKRWLIKWLIEFRGLTIRDRIIRKLFSKKAVFAYLRRTYSDHTVLRMLEHVRGEEDVEVMQRGLTDFFNMK